MLISGVMSKGSRYVHTFAFWFMSLWFVGFVVMSARFIFGGANRGLLISSALFLMFALFAIAGSYRYRRALISEFSYDGAILRFRTLGRPEMEALPVLEIVDLKEWKGRGGPTGYRLKLRDGRKLYLEFAVSNSSALAQHILSGLPSGRGSTV